MTAIYALQAVFYSVFLIKSCSEVFLAVLEDLMHRRVKIARKVVY